MEITLLNCTQTICLFLPLAVEVLTSGAGDGSRGDAIDAHPKLAPLEGQGASDTVNSSLGS